jgi:hypothetical protein
MTELIGPILTGLGLGAIAKSILDFFITQKTNKNKLAYSEMRDAYIGLLDALHKAAIEPSDINSKNFALWQTRVSLFGSPNVANAVQEIIDTNGDTTGKRDAAFNKLINSMKEDLSKKAA